ncbi:hypothetical protein Q9189_001978 [Teloschistes chrysophthalmus]
MSSLPSISRRTSTIYPDLKTLIVGKITSHIDVQKRPIEFLQMAKKTYTHMPDSEDTFRTFFKETAAKLPKQGEMAQKLIHVFNDCILDGGVMAIDMFAALCAESTGQAGKRELDESKFPAVSPFFAPNLDHANGFDSQIFTITVGSEGKTLTAHAAYLSQSPVLERMCNSRFRESETLTINLPEDEVEIIQATIQYFYTGDFWVFGSTATLETTEGIGKDAAVKATGCEKLAAAENLATMYITADKYQIQDLKSLVVKKLAAVVDTNIPDSDEAYRSFFKSSFGTIASIEPNSKELRQLIEVCIYNGGILAQDIVEVREAELKKKSTAHSDVLGQQLAEQSEILTYTQALLGELEKANKEESDYHRDWQYRMKKFHARQHKGCQKCFVELEGKGRRVTWKLLGAESVVQMFRKARVGLDKLFEDFVAYS